MLGAMSSNTESHVLNNKNKNERKQKKNSVTVVVHIKVTTIEDFLWQALIQGLYHSF
jgi:hypothetical protein